MSPSDKPLVWLQSEVKTPPFSAQARLDAGFYLRLLQRGESLGMPISRPLPQLGRGCHELRIRDRGATWRILYRIDTDAIVIAEVFSKKSRTLPQTVLETCRRRLREYDHA